MKTTTPLLVGTLLLGALYWTPEHAAGQTGMPVLLGPLNDGTPPPSPPPSPPLATGPVREVSEFQLRHGSASLCRVLSPRRGLAPNATQPVAEGDRFPTDPVVPSHPLLERDTIHRLAFVSAVVYDHRWSYVTWQSDWDWSRTFAAWSNVDFNHFTQIPDLEVSGVRFSFFTSISNEDAAGLAAVVAVADPDNLPPPPPALPPWESAFVVANGDPADADGILPVRGLHDLYKTERFRLAAAFQGRERARLARESWLKANPPQPKHHVLYHYAIQPEKIQPQRLQGGPR